VSGRLKDIIIRGGENLSPGQIEARAARRTPRLKVCCVVGAPDSDLGEVPVAFVVAHAGCRVDAEELRNIVADRLPRAWVPRRVVAAGRPARDRRGQDRPQSAAFACGEFR
jgi:acyl-CoA synthetase (AMP-forming)/AMP-acid ligase II